MFRALVVADLPSKNELKTLQTIFKAYIFPRFHEVWKHDYLDTYPRASFFETRESTISFYIVGSHHMQKEISPA